MDFQSSILFSGAEADLSQYQKVFLFGFRSTLNSKAKQNFLILCLSHPLPLESCQTKILAQNVYYNTAVTCLPDSAERLVFLFLNIVFLINVQHCFKLFIVLNADIIVFLAAVNGAC